MLILGNRQTSKNGGNKVRKALIGILFMVPLILFSESDYVIEYSPNNSVTFSVGKYGDLEFELSGSGYVSYDYEGKVTKQADQYISYAYHGKPSKIGNIFISYDYQKRPTKIGNLYISYDYEGKISKFGNSYFSYDSDKNLTSAGKARISYNHLGKPSNISGSVGGGLRLRLR